MPIDFEELAYRDTPFGELSLRRRIEPSLGTEVHEVTLGNAFLMSSLFTRSEIALAGLALAGLEGRSLDVVVGGLGLGYTARAVLHNPAVRSLRVVEALADVIDWHRRALVPLGAELTADPRCALVNGDFFALVDSPAIDSTAPGRRFDPILVDIDHSPARVLHPAHAGFYRRAGLRRASEHLRPSGVFGLWSDDPPDAAFQAELDAVFARSQAQVVHFAHPLQGRQAACTVYIAHGFAIA
jgi:spermidine synthase